MKMNSKKLSILAFLVLTLIPILIFAKNATTTAGNVLCNKIVEIFPKITERFTTREAKIIEKKTEISQKIQERWTEQDFKLAEKRTKWDENRNEHFAKLQEKAQTDVQKQAVLTFIQAVNEAVVARRLAIDTAITNFRQAMEQTRISRQTAIGAAKNTLRNSVSTILDKEKNECVSDTNAVAIRQNLKNELVAAKEKYQSDYQEIEKISTTIDQLITIRKAAIEKAIQDFKVAVEKARNDFKIAVNPTATP